MRLHVDPLTGSVVIVPKKELRVYRSEGGGGGGGKGFVSRVIPTPSPNGVATTFTTPVAYSAGSLMVFLNSAFQTGITEASSTTFTTSFTPITGDEIAVCYQLA